MKKIDVAVQSYNKAESLIFTLFTLHKYCKESVDTVWINDDKSAPGVIEKYQKLSDSKALYPWKIKIRVNEKRVGWWVSFCAGRIPKYASFKFILKRMLWNFYKNKSFFVGVNDFRYQWAIENTDKSRLMIIHDDVEFLDDAVNLLQGSLDRQAIPGISGELGQCWRCRYKNEGCTPSKILKGYRPDRIWPMTRKQKGDHKWACRVNEWVAMLDVNAAHEISSDENVFFGNCDDEGDTGAFWFSRLVSRGYSFDDPFLREDSKSIYFKHWDGGITGHSIWVDQGNGKNTYNAQELNERIYKEFGYEL
ncbi:hypothetical protein [Kangiella sp.]|uniref:hypothetical protein n=1 Tax=Kangiella sp. TaxID=1920245 RepID=UPI003A93469B